MNPSRMTPVEISAKLRARKRFDVANESARRRVHEAAKYLGVEITTESNGSGGFTVKFVSPN